jgi:hypothetical protein
VCAQVLPPGGRLVSIEKDLSWLLVAKRFLWQASQGEKNKQRQTPLGSTVRMTSAKHAACIHKLCGYKPWSCCCIHVYSCACCAHHRRALAQLTVSMYSSGGSRRPKQAAADPTWQYGENDKCQSEQSIKVHSVRYTCCSPNSIMVLFYVVRCVLAAAAAAAAG